MELELLLYKSTSVLQAVVKDELTQLPINDATVTATLKHRNGGEVAAQTWPLTLAYVALSEGMYRGLILHSITVAIDDELRAEVTATASGGRRIFKAPRVKVVLAE